jgi:threonine efflux protein
LYLGIRGLRARKEPAPAGGVAAIRHLPSSAARQVLGGFLCNAFNPKAPIYFLALFTVVLAPGLPLPTLLAYGAWIMLLQWLWFSLVATVFAHHMIRDRLFAVRHWIDRAFGAAMVALGLRVWVSTRE